MGKFPHIFPYLERCVVFERDFFLSSPSNRVLGTLHPRGKFLSYSMDVGKKTLSEYLYGIFLESLVSDLSISKETLDRMKWVFSSGSYTGEFLVSLLLTA